MSPLGVEAFAEALLVIPKTLALNSGLDSQDALVKLKDENTNSEIPLGLDISTGEVLDPTENGIFDNYRVTKQLLHSW